ncbi:MAG: hypothetical protein QOF01_4281, partial [Thermomicrobiales bacterium]|nr:hypothetical protein [Thermomicrobiales bacterium]
MLQRLTAPRFLAYLLALLVALNLSVEFANLNGRRGLFLADGNLPVGRDFAVFFAAGDIVAEGDGAALYSLDRQQQELSRLLERDEFFLPFAYPAFVALPYALLSRLPYLWAYALGTAVMFGAFVAAVHMLRQGSLSARDHTGFLLLGLFAYSPVTWATFGGLNGAFSLLCLAGAYASLVSGRAGSAGLWLGCLLFKPQLAGPLLLLLLWRRQWRTVATAVVVGLVLSVAGALATKPTWPVDLAVLTSSDRYLDPERECCGRLHSSLVGVVSWWLGGNDWPTILISTAVGAVTVALTIYAWR